MQEKWNKGRPECQNATFAEFFVLMGVSDPIGVKDPLERYEQIIWSDPPNHETLQLPLAPKNLHWDLISKIE